MVSALYACPPSLESRSLPMQKRAVGQAYDELVDELMMALRSRYGPLTLIHWEDFGVQNAFTLLAKYQEQVGA